MIFLQWYLRQHSKHASFQGKGIKKLNPKQIVQRLTIAFAQIKAGNTSKNLLNEIHQIIDFFYQSNKTTKKAYNNTKDSINI